MKHFTTNFSQDFFFEAIVTVNLTSLLVLTTLFISVSSSLPQTAYVKMVDLWLIFAQVEYIQTKEPNKLHHLCRICSITSLWIRKNSKRTRTKHHKWQIAREEKIWFFLLRWFPGLRCCCTLWSTGWGPRRQRGSRGRSTIVCLFVYCLFVSFCCLIVCLLFVCSLFVCCLFVCCLISLCFLFV